MAITSPPKRQRLFWSRLHFGIRLLGLTGALVACVAAVLAGVKGKLIAYREVATAQDAYQASRDITQAVLTDPAINVLTGLLLLGVVVALAALLIEVFVILAFTATRRSAFGFNALLQGALAAALLVAVNVWSFNHYERIDGTRDREFTLPTEIRKELAQLDPRSKTTVIVYQRHKAIGSVSDKPQDDFDSA